MTIETERNESALTVRPIGWLDTVSSPELAKFVDNELTGVTSLTFDLSQLENLTSAGLRVLLVAQKKMNAVGKMVVMHANDSVKEVFEFTGFAEVLNLVD